VNAAAVALLVASFAAAAIDVRTRRIPNALTSATALVALGLHCSAGPLAVAIALGAMIAAFLVGSVAFSAGWFGGGDVKLLAACCGLASFPGAIALVLYVLIAGMLLALVTAAVNGRLVALVRSSAAVAAHGVPLSSNTLPYGVAIAAGSFAYALSTLVPVLRLPV
jgi:prepilin peptidase CpaA